LDMQPVVDTTTRPIYALRTNDPPTLRTEKDKFNKTYPDAPPLRGGAIQNRNKINRIRVFIAITVGPTTPTNF